MIEKPLLSVESAPGTPVERPEGRRGWGYAARVVNLAREPVFCYSAPIPAGDFEPAIGHSYPSSCQSGEVVVRFVALCTDYDADSRLGSFEVRGKEAGQLGRLLSGLALLASSGLQSHEAERLSSEGGQVADPASDDWVS